MRRTGFSGSKSRIAGISGVTLPSVLVALAALVTIVLTVFSPFSLEIIGKNSSADWVRLGNIGQAYGIASALFSALALLSISASIYYQARQVRAQVVQTVRSAHTELLRMVIDEPETYAQCVGTWPEDMSAEKTKQYIFMTLWFNFARMGLESGTVSESALRDEILRDSFSTDLGLEWWTFAKADWASGRNARHNSSRFFALVESEHRARLLERSSVADQPL